MPAQTSQPEQVSKFQAADSDAQKMRQVVKGIEYKSQHDGSVVEGYVATTGIDRAGDYFTEEALQEMAQQIQAEIEQDNANVKVVFPEFSEEDLKQIKQNYTSNGNVDHYNNPGYPMGDPRIVSAYKIVDAEYDGFGVKVKARLNEDLPFGVPEAIKAGLQEGYLDGFSVEFIAKKARNVVKEGQKVREILSSKFTGASLTGRPIQNSASVTDAEFKSMVQDIQQKTEEQESKAKHGDEMEEKATVAGVKFQGTRDGSLDESRIPSEGFEDHYLVDGENKTESSYPVVDADGYLRRGNVEDAWNLRGQADDISKDELESMLEDLNDEFDNPPISEENIQESKSFINRVEELEDERSAWQELKNDITGDTMPDEQEQEQDPEPEEEQDQEDVEEQESKSAAEELREELSEVRQEIKSVVEENEQLKEEKDEMEQKFDNLDEDLEGIQEVKSEIDELKQELKNVTPENAPQQDTDETRDQQVSEQESKSALERQLGAYSNPQRIVDNQDMKAAIADRHGVTPDEVEEKAQELA